MESPRPIWQRPEMTVLARGRPEEGALATCKHTLVEPLDSHVHAGNCGFIDLTCVVCHGFFGS